jgi:hypothetical protein
MPWAWPSPPVTVERSATSSDRLDQLTQYRKLERLLDQWPGGPGNEVAQAGRGEVSSRENKAGEEIRAVLGEPVVQLDARAMGHEKIGDHHLVATGSGSPQLSQRHSPVLGFVGIPTPAAQVTRQCRPNRRLVIDNQRASQACGGGDLSR